MNDDPDAPGCRCDRCGHECVGTVIVIGNFEEWICERCNEKGSDGDA